MGIISTLLRPTPPQAAAVTGTGDYGWVAMGSSGGIGSASIDAALESSPVWRCGNLIATGIASLPCILYKRLPDNERQRALGHQLYTVLHDSPAPGVTAFEFWEAMVWSLLFRGNAFALKVPNVDGPVAQLHPLNPDRISIESVPTGQLLTGGIPEYRPRYRYKLGSGMEVILLDDEVLHIKGLSLDGVRGVSVIEYARRSIEIGRATEAYGARFFSEGSTPRGVLQSKGQITPEAARRLASDWQSLHGGIDNAHRVAVLEEGIEWKQISIAPEDSQFLQTREFQISEVCRWFGIVAPWLVGSQNLQTTWGTGIEQTSIGHVTYTLLPWIRRIEAAIQIGLISQPRSYFAEFLIDGFTRGDLASRYSAYAIGRQWGWLSVNDIRRAENHNPLGPEGDVYLQPMNMMSADQQADVEDGDPVDAPAATVAPSPAGAPATEPTVTAAIDAAHYHALLTDAAARIVRREVTALSKVAKRTADDTTGWAAEVTEFYDQHTDLVAETMRIPLDRARAYTSGRATTLIRGGASVLADIDAQQGIELVRLTLTTGGRS